MAGETSLLSGEDGHKIVHELLSLFGWNTADHIEFDCSQGERHKSKETAKGPRKNHNIDMLFQYDSPLNHRNRDIALISVKHNLDAYPSGLGSLYNAYIKDIAQCVHCAPASNDLEVHIASTDRVKNFFGLIFWLSSSDQEKEQDLVGGLQDKISHPRLTEFNSIYIIDNRKATFLYSSIELARGYRSDTRTKFLYHHTGLNQSAEKIILADTILPVELLNSSILPVVKETDDKTSVLLFCNCAFNKEYLKRIIWLSHKLCPLSNEILIYFTDYDATRHSALVASTKHDFSDTDFINKIQVKKLVYKPFTILKEMSSNDDPITYTSQTRVKERRVAGSPEEDKQIDRILPFGEMIKPILSSSQLTDTDLKEFLETKGIIVKSSDKETTVPIFASMLLLPEELDKIRDMLEEKEEKLKSVIRRVPVEEGVSLREIVSQNLVAFDEIKPEMNCTLTETPQLKMKNDGSAEVQFKMKRENATKDLITGTTYRNSSISLSQVGNELIMKVEYTSTESKKHAYKAVDRMGQRLKHMGYAKSDAVSIRFGDFDNETRINFLLGFTQGVASDHFYNGIIENIKFKPDGGAGKLPDDLEPMKDTVSNLNINGSNLDKLSYVKSDLYKPCVLLERVKVKFDFELNGEIGFCVVEIGFPSSLNNKTVDYQTELQTSITIPPIKGNKKLTTKLSTLEHRLSKKLDDFVMRRYALIKPAGT